jgi:predicted NAD-dependent protein-ADP-ribosyltransferase YbiA (DUF1768 family)
MIKLASSDYIYFGSASKEPYNVLSNFHHATVHFRGQIFNSSEHAYQSTKFVEVERFAKGGDLSDFVAFKTFKSIFFGKKASDADA